MSARENRAKSRKRTQRSRARIGVPAVAAVAAVGLFGPGLGSAQAAVPAFSFTELGNLNPGAVSSSPFDFTAVGSDVYFYANTGTANDLFVSEGGAAAQLVTAAGVAIPAYYGGVTDVGSTAYFLSNAGGNGVAIWVANGNTATETGLLIEDPARLENAGGELYFEAKPAGGGDSELWTSDGTHATAVLDLSSQNLYLSSPVVSVGTSSFFTTYKAKSYAETLWETTGGPAAPVTGSSAIGEYSDPSYLTNAGGTLYFTSDKGDELWEAEGAGGLEQVPGVNSSNIEGLTAAGSELFFSPDHVGLEATNGATNGTVNLFPNSADVSYETNVGGELFFVAESTDTLSKSDGTRSGTASIELFAGSLMTHLTNDNGTLAFDVNGTNGASLWTSDGTSANTAASANAPAIGTNFGAPLTNDGSNLYFAANGGTDGLEPWVAVAPTPPPPPAPPAPPATSTSTTPTPSTPAPAPPAPTPTVTTPTPTPAPVPTPAPAVPKVTIVSATSKANALTLKLKCPAGTAVCTVTEQVVVTEAFKGKQLVAVSALRYGRSSLEMARSGASRPDASRLKTTTRTVVLATKTVKINPGKTVSVVVKLDKAGTTLLSSRKKLTVAVRLTVNGRLETVRKVTLKAPVVKQKTTKHQ